jgi:putative ABC transport system permease protein
MMDDRRAVNRSMFWRVIRRMVFSNRGRLLVILLALGAGAAVTAALLNLQVDAKRRITTEFRSFGANVIISAHARGDSQQFLSDKLFDQIPNGTREGPIAKAEFLYGVVEVSEDNEGAADPSKSRPVIVAGYGYLGSRAKDVVPTTLLDYQERIKFGSSMRCGVGYRVAGVLKLAEFAGLQLRNGRKVSNCTAILLSPTGGPEDDQIFFYLSDTQDLLGQQGHVSLIQLNVPGTSQQVERFLAELRPQLGDADGRPIRQFTEGQTGLYGKISGMLTATVVVVMVLTALCVMAAMTNIAAERKNDVGLMKAIGGSVRRVLRIFLAEAALLGLVGGAIGAAVGIAISIGLGKAVFGVAAQPRLVVYPVSVALTVIVAILAAYPLRRLANIRPASVFRGEE